MTSVFDQLNKFRYLPSTRPIPWDYIRGIDVSAMKVNSPDLHLVKNVTSVVSDCNISPLSISGATTTTMGAAAAGDKSSGPLLLGANSSVVGIPEMIQLASVLQAMLQFQLHSTQVLRDQFSAKQNNEAVQKVTLQQVTALEDRLELAKKKLEESEVNKKSLETVIHEQERRIVELQTKVNCLEKDLQFERDTLHITLAGRQNQQQPQYQKNRRSKTRRIADEIEDDEEMKKAKKKERRVKCRKCGHTLGGRHCNHTPEDLLLRQQQQRTFDDGGGLVCGEDAATSSVTTLDATTTTDTASTTTTSTRKGGKKGHHHHRCERHAAQQYRSNSHHQQQPPKYVDWASFATLTLQQQTLSVLQQQQQQQLHLQQPSSLHQTAATGGAGTAVAAAVGVEGRGPNGGASSGLQLLPPQTQPPPPQVSSLHAQLPLQRLSQEEVTAAVATSQQKKENHDDPLGRKGEAEQQQPRDDDERKEDIPTTTTTTTTTTTNDQCGGTTVTIDHSTHPQQQQQEAEALPSGELWKKMENMLRDQTAATKLSLNKIESSQHNVLGSVELLERQFQRATTEQEKLYGEVNNLKEKVQQQQGRGGGGGAVLTLKKALGPSSSSLETSSMSQRPPLAATSANAGKGSTDASASGGVSSKGTLLLGSASLGAKRVSSTNSLDDAGDDVDMVMGGGVAQDEVDLDGSRSTSPTHMGSSGHSGEEESRVPPAAAAAAVLNATSSSGSGSATFPCTHCRQRFPNKNELAEHEAECDLRFIHCPDCGSRVIAKLLPSHRVEKCQAKQEENRALLQQNNTSTASHGGGGGVGEVSGLPPLGDVSNISTSSTTHNAAQAVVAAAAVRRTSSQYLQEHQSELERLLAEDKEAEERKQQQKQQRQP